MKTNRLLQSHLIGSQDIFHFSTFFSIYSEEEKTIFAKSKWDTLGVPLQSFLSMTEQSE